MSARPEATGPIMGDGAGVIDHRAALARIDPETRVALTTLSDGPGLVHLAGHVAAIGATSTVIILGLPLWPLALFAQGVLLAFLFTLLHETTHGTAFRTAGLNRWIGRVCGAALAIGPVWFHHFHMAHHRWTQIPGKDPELRSPKPETWRAYLWHVSGVPLWISLATTLWRNARGRCRDPFLPDAKRPHATREARGMLALYALVVVLAWDWAVWLWVLPLILGQPVLRLYLLAEHGRCALVANMLENSRTTLTTRAVRWLAWNMPYHAEHHCAPRVPFHKLPDLHHHLAPHLRAVSPGYGAFHRDLTTSFAGDRP